MPNEDLKTTEKTRLIRVPHRGSFDRNLAYKIIDSSPMCHVSYIIEGEPYITPTLHWRTEDSFFWHGSSASRFLRSINGKPVSINVTILDGLVLARSAFHHSANYRSVTLFGNARLLSPKEKEKTLKGFLDQLLPERWDHLRKITEQEIKATTVFTIPIDEASVKTRAGEPVDDESDYKLPIWAGVIPIKLVVEEPVPDQQNLHGLETPKHVAKYTLE